MRKDRGKMQELDKVVKMIHDMFMNVISILQVDSASMVSLRTFGSTFEHILS